MPVERSKANRVAIVGASSLRGKELKQVLEDRGFPATEIMLLDEGVMAGTLTEAGGEPTFIRALDEDSFEGAHFVFFAADAGSAERNWPAARRAGATVIDMTGALVRAGSAATWIPSLASMLPPRGMGREHGSLQNAHAFYSPSAPVVLACTVAAALAAFSPMRTAMLLFPPVSERDQAGIEELESQTASLLSFREVAKPVFDAQVAFNLLSSYGGESKVRLELERREIARDVTSFLDGRALIPAIQLVQAPVFYGYTFTGFAEFAELPEPAAVEAQFARCGVRTAAPESDPPNNISVAGESEIHVARFERDPNVGGGAWLWGAADNLRLAAMNAVRIAEELLATVQ